MVQQGDPARDLAATLGGMDIYLVDQIVRGRVRRGARVLDVGAGGGRNLLWFLRHGYDACGLDANPGAIDALRKRARAVRPDLSGEDLAQRLRCEALEATSFPAEGFDLVIANAVLHFARGADHFRSMLDAACARLAPGGLLFARLTSSIGLESKLVERGDGRFLLPDGSERYLVTAADLRAVEERFALARVDPLKTTNVDDLRCMTTWIAARA